MYKYDMNLDLERVARNEIAAVKAELIVVILTGNGRLNDNMDVLFIKVEKSTRDFI